MTEVDNMAAFVRRPSYDNLSPATRTALKIRILDALGCALGTLDGPPIHQLRQQIDEFGGTPLCTLIGGRRSAPDQAAFYNAALVRYLDFNDFHLANGETCHPSDNLELIADWTRLLACAGGKQMKEG